MSFSLEQAKALDAIARKGSIARAAESLNKVHSAILYSIKTMEERAGLKLLDRTGYRSKLTPEGQRVWDECQKLLAAERDLMGVVGHLKSGWEPSFKVVFDGLLPSAGIIQSLQSLVRQGCASKLFFFSEFLSEVEDVFERELADVMITVLPRKNLELTIKKLRPIRAILVAHKSHPIVKENVKISAPDLMEHTFITVRGSDLRLQLSTSSLDRNSMLHLSDFDSKKAALMAKMGYGWMPEHMVTAELKKGTLKLVKWEGKSRHSFEPVLAYRKGAQLGRAGQIFVDAVGKHLS